MKDNIRVRYPSYLKKFKCIGGKCEDNCCGEWEICIDKDTFEQYTTIKDKTMSEYIFENILITDNPKDVNANYGHIKLNTSNKCPFLGKDKYCTIHGKLGEEYLSNVCTTFPRVINKLGEFYEMSLDISCIEAARIVLLKEEGIEFEEEENTLGKHALTVSININDEIANDTNYKYIEEIRNISIKIIKNRKYELSERLYMLGAFLESIRKELCYNYNNVTQFINSFNINSFSGEFNRNKEDYMLQVSFYKTIFEKLNIFEEYKSDYFQERIREVMMGLRLSNNESIIENSELILKAYDTFDENILKRYSYIFENYLVNHMFKELFPFSESDVISDDYIMMLVRYSYIRFYLVGQYIYNGEPSKDDIIRSIQILSKEVEHHKTYLKSILKYLKEYELDNKRFARILL